MIHNKTTPKVSIIVPIYKTELYLSNCIDSILNQTFSDFELILVDDGSPDSCGSICDDYSKKDKRIRVIHKENGGQSSARNAGLDAAVGDYISFIDSDDTVEQAFLETMISKIGDCDLCVCYCRRVYFKNGVIKQLVEPKVVKDHIVDENEFWLSSYDIRGFKVFPVNKLYRKQLFNGVRFVKMSSCEDAEIMHKIIGNCRTIRIIPDVLYTYNRREESVMSNASSKELIINMLDIYIERCEFYKRRNNHILFDKSYQGGISELRRALKNNFSPLNKYFDYFKKKYKYLSKKNGKIKFFVLFPRISTFLSNIKHKKGK